MRDYLVKQVPTGPLTGEDTRRFYLFSLPNSAEPHFYRDVTAYNAYFNSTKRRNWHTAVGLLYIGSPLCEFQFLLTHDDPFSAYDQQQMTRHPPTRCADIWEFFDKIGWDHRAKKYLPVKVARRRKR